MVTVSLAWGHPPHTHTPMVCHEEDFGKHPRPLGIVSTKSPRVPPLGEPGDPALSLLAWTEGVHARRLSPSWPRCCLGRSGQGSNPPSPSPLESPHPPAACMYERFLWSLRREWLLSLPYRCPWWSRLPACLPTGRPLSSQQIPMSPYCAFSVLRDGARHTQTQSPLYCPVETTHRTTVQSGNESGLHGARET